MGLILNGMTVRGALVYQSGGPGADIIGGLNNWHKRMNRFAGQGFNTPKSSVPVGYIPPYAWAIAKKSGGLASFNFVIGNGGVTAGNLAGGRNAGATITGSGQITYAEVQLIIEMLATIVGEGTLDADINGKLEAAATLSGDGAIDASMGALADLVAAINAAGSVDASARADAYMSATVTPYADLSPQSLATAVWNAVADSYNGDNITMEQVMKLLVSVAAGKSTGGGTSEITYRNLGDSADVVVGTVDGVGNRNDIQLGV